MRAALVMLLLCCWTLPAQAGRVVTLAPHLAELVCAVGQCAQLVGVIKYSDYPPEVLKRPLIGDAVAVNVEAVLALKPDLVLSWDGGTPEQTVTRLKRVGLRVESIRVRSLEEVGMALLRVGALLGAEDAACAAEHDFRERIASLRTRYANAVPIDVLFQLDAEPVLTVNRESPISEALALCGARNIFADYPRLAGPVGREAVIASDPGAILFGNHDDVAGIRRGWLRFPRMKALRANNLIPVNSDKLARSTPRMAEGTAELCKALDAARARLSALR